MRTSTCLGTPKARSIPWYLFIFHRHSLPEPASVVCDFEQGDIFYFAGPHRMSVSVMLQVIISLIPFKCNVTYHYQSDSISFSVVLRGSPHQSLSMWLTDHPSSISVSVMSQIIHHPSLSVWCYRSYIIKLCQYDVTDHPSSISVSVMLQIIHHQTLSVWGYRSSITNPCQCEVTDHPSSVSVSVMLQIIHHQSLSVWWIRVTQRLHTIQRTNEKTHAHFNFHLFEVWFCLQLSADWETWSEN